MVNGIKYFLTLELVPTNCSRPRAEGDECITDPEAAALLYSVEILQHPQQEPGAELLLFGEVSAGAGDGDRLLCTLLYCTLVTTILLATTLRQQCMCNVEMSVEKDNSM